MTDLHNPLFEDEKEFLERQKLEYERALLGDVEEIKAKTQEVGKYVAIGAGVLGGLWLLTKAFGSKKKDALGTSKEYQRHLLAAPKTKRRTLASTAVDTAVADDLGFGTGHQQSDSGRPVAASDRVHIAPDVYHTDADPFAPLQYESSGLSAYPAQSYRYSPPQAEEPSVVTSAVKSFLQSDTGKMLIAQASAVLMAYVAKKAGEYLPILKNADLAASDSVRAEPETRDIEFTYHHDDADAPHQPL